MNCKLLLILVFAMLNSCSQSGILKPKLLEISEQLIEIRRAQANLKLRLDEFNNRLLVLRTKLAFSRNPQITGTKHNINSPSKSGDSINIKISNPAKAVELPKVSKELPASWQRLNGLSGNPVVKLDILKLGKIALYRYALNLYKSKRYHEAIEGFTRFFKQYPLHSLADNALYWLGVCRFHLGQYAWAIETWSQILKSYAKGNKIPDSLFQIALAHWHLNHVRKARRLWIRLVRRFPGSDAAVKAKKRLRRRNTG